jgi:hypothetical protein
MKKFMGKIATDTLGAMLSITAATVTNCLLGHGATKGECGFRNVKLPCAREWLKLSDKS